MPKQTSSQFISWSAAPTFSAETGTARSWSLNAFIKNPKHLNLTYQLALGYSYPTGWSGPTSATTDPSIHWNGSGSPVARTPMKWQINATGETSKVSPEGWVETKTAAVVLPVQPVSVAATAVSTTAIEITWSAGTGGSAPTSYKLYHSTTGLAGSYTVLDANATSPKTHSGLVAGSYHSYYVVAVNSNGESGPSLSDDATTFPGNPQPVTSIVASAISSSEIRIDWIPSMVEPLATSYIVRGGTTVTNPLPQIAEVNEPDHFYVNTGLDASTSYDYVVRAKVAGLESVNSTRVTAVTKAPEAPATPSNVSATALGPSSIAVEWRAGDSTQTSFNVYHATSATGTFSLLANYADPDTDGIYTYPHENLAAASNHCYRITAVNDNGESQQSFEACATTQADFPTAPVNVQVIPISDTTLRVEWVPGSGGSPVVNYKVYSAADPADNFLTITPDGVAETFYEDSSLSANTTRYYRVRAFDAEGDSKVSATVSGTTKSAPVPGVPINVTATSTGATTVRVNWTPDPNGGTATGFKIYRATSPTGFTTGVADPDNASPYNDSGLTSGVTYYYCVTALDSGQSYESGKSVIVSVRTDVTNAPDTTSPTAVTLSGSVAGNSISLSWTASSDPTVAGQDRTGVSEYYIYRDGARLNTTPSVITGLTYIDQNLQPATSYSYVVRAKDGAGNLSPVSNTLTKTTSSGSQLAYLLNDGFESGSLISLWKTSVTEGGTLTIVTDPILGGTKKCVRTVLDRTTGLKSDRYRSEVFTNFASSQEPRWRQEVWYGWRTLFPAGWVSDPQWCVTMQCHGRFVPSHSSLNPVVAFYLNGTTIKCVGRWWDGLLDQNGNVINDAPQVFSNVVATLGGNITTGAWTYFVMRIVWNWDNSGSVPGQCQLWVNGTSQMNYTGKLGYNTYDDAGKPVTPNFRLGLYMSKNSEAASIVRTIYNDSVRIIHTNDGGSYTAVDPSGNLP